MPIIGMIEAVASADIVVLGALTLMVVFIFGAALGKKDR